MDQDHPAQGTRRSLTSPYALKPNPSEAAKRRAADWAAAMFASGGIPFGFTYGGISSADLLPNWSVARSGAQRDANRSVETVTHTDPKGGLEVRCEVTNFLDSAAVEWVLHFRNGGSADTPILENIQALHTRFDRDPSTEGLPEFVLHRSLGSSATQLDFAPVSAEPGSAGLFPGDLGERLGPKAQVVFASSGGRSSNGALPFFNLAWGDGGVIVGIGWTGQWAASIARDEGTRVVVSAGMEHTHLTLHPGEEIRSPRIVLLFWTGKRVQAHNHFRRFFTTHHIPKVDGQPVTAPLAACGWILFDPDHWGVGVTEQNQLEYARRFHELGLLLQAYWLDAGWFDHNGVWWAAVGNWYPNPRTFPRGLRPLADAAHEMGMSFIVWFEPGRVYQGTMLDREHPDWLLRLPDNPHRLFDFANPEAREALTDLVSDLITSQGIDVYREDFNVDPLPYWQGQDAPDRQGICEIHWIEGLYAFWDELLRRHPGLVIDNCASGGRRLDLETMSRSVPFWRTDYFSLPLEPNGRQSQTWALNQYIPVSATNVEKVDAYDFRSAMSNGLCFLGDPRRADFPLEQARRSFEEQLRLSPLFMGDYYPLTAYSFGPDAWMAYQFDRPDLGRGAILAFRREESPYSSATFKLGGLTPKASYELAFEDTGEHVTLLGQDLADGLELRIDQPRSSLLITYTLSRGASIMSC